MGEDLAPKAESIPIDRLAAAVQAAVSDVSAKHGIDMGKAMIFKPGTLIGRQLRAAGADLAQLQKVASEVTAQVQRAGVSGGAQLVPSVLLQGGVIIAGYFPMDQAFEVSAGGG